jgi:hypothetical protein
MGGRIIKNVVLTIAMACAAGLVFAVFFRGGLASPVKTRAPTESAAVRQKAHESPAVAVKEEVLLPKGWVENFGNAGSGLLTIPAGWMVENKPGTALADFSVRRDEKAGGAFLHMEADKASASIITRLNGVDLNKTPYLRWRWRIKTLPEGADGRFGTKDDQAIGIYVGTGSTLSNKSVSYRWDTRTPKGAEGSASYGLGIIKVKWITLRNEEDAAGGQWITEERNVAEDFEKAWGFYPDEVYLSVSCNSQYTGSKAGADLDWIGFDASPLPGK